MIYISPKKISCPKKHPFRGGRIDLKPLESSIREHGIVTALNCHLQGGKIIVFDGILRLKVARKLGLKKIPITLPFMLEALYTDLTPDNVWQALQRHSVESLSMFLGKTPCQIRWALMS